ncbi:hypothetical protein QUF80_05740 [Desulfococcaceae bacterium HSG8]|nr:hypothetical protein [Desulfococcaceae bacterium HSG8]
MSINDLSLIQDIFCECIRDIAVLERFESDGRFFESDSIRKEKTDWIVIAAGLDESEAKQFFPGNSKRAERSAAPLRYKSCKISMLFVVKPFDGDMNSISMSSLLITPFAPNKNIPLIRIRNAFLNVYDIPDNKNKLRNFRWEWDTNHSFEEPYEKWLRSWKNEIGFNPAHPPSHFHINSESYKENIEYIKRAGDSIDDLRISVGNPNPLSLILSVAVWLRTL